MLVDHFRWTSYSAMACICSRVFEHLYWFVLFLFCFSLACLFPSHSFNVLQVSLLYLAFALICFIADILIVCHVVSSDFIYSILLQTYTQMWCTVVVEHFSMVMNLSWLLSFHFASNFMMWYVILWFSYAFAAHWKLLLFRCSYFATNFPLKTSNCMQ